MSGPCPPFVVNQEELLEEIGEKCALTDYPLSEGERADALTFVVSLSKQGDKHVQGIEEIVEHYRGNPMVLYFALFQYGEFACYAQTWLALVRRGVVKSPSIGEVIGSMIDKVFRGRG